MRNVNFTLILNNQFCCNKVIYLEDILIINYSNQYLDDVNLQRNINIL